MSERALFKKVVELYEDKNYEECLEEIEDLLSKFKKKSKYFNYKGLAEYALDRFEDVVESFDSAIDIFKENGEFYLN